MSDDKVIKGVPEDKGTKPPATKPQAKWDRAQKLIYLGSPIVERGSDGQVKVSVKYGQIYSNGLPVAIKERCDADKEFKRFFVSVDNASGMMRELSKKDSPLSEARRKMGLPRYEARNDKGGRK